MASAPPRRGPARNSPAIGRRVRGYWPQTLRRLRRLAAAAQGRQRDRAAFERFYALPEPPVRQSAPIRSRSLPRSWAPSTIRARTSAVRGSARSFGLPGSALRGISSGLRAEPAREDGHETPELSLVRLRRDCGVLFRAVRRVVEHRRRRVRVDPHLVE
jgi:hypothetical protein